MTDPAPAIWSALRAVMSDVQSVSKDGRNQQQGFNFRGIDAVVNAVGPAFREHGVICTPHLKRWERRQYETGRGTMMMETLVEVDYTFTARDGSSLTCTVPGEASDAGDKGLAKAMSVAYRTALLQALCIPTDEQDPDATTTTRKAPRSAATGSDAPAPERKASRPAPSKPRADAANPAPAVAGHVGPVGPTSVCHLCGDMFGDHSLRKQDGRYVHRVCPRDKGKN